MSKKQVVFIIAASVLIGWLFNIFPGRFLAAKISTWPLLNKWQILSPQAPIVITNRETVRVSDGSDILQAANSAKSKISALVQVKGSVVTVAGSAVNLTSDGSFVTAAASFAGKNPSSYFVVLSDGRQAQVTQEVADPATALVFFKARLDGVPAASLGNSKDLSPGDQIVFVQNSLQGFSSTILSSWVVSGQADIEGQILKSDYPSRAFSAQVNSGLANGEPAVDINGDIVGIWNASSVISSDVLKAAMALYFNSQQAIIRPEFGFTYQQISQNDMELTAQVTGAKVLSVASGSPARQAGLAAGDIITQADGQAVNETSPLEEILQNYKPGDSLTLTLDRKGQLLNINLTVGELQ